VDRCEYPDNFGHCNEGTCYDPEQDTTICAPGCWDYCGSYERCGTINNVYGYCDGSFCVIADGGLGCGPADDDGACIV
jgi:hypothetical protein